MFRLILYIMLALLNWVDPIPSQDEGGILMESLVLEDRCSSFGKTVSCDTGRTVELTPNLEPNLDPNSNPALISGWDQGLNMELTPNLEPYAMCVSDPENTNVKK